MILWFKLVFAYIWFKYQSYLNLNCSMINDDYEFDSSHGFRVVSRFPKGQATWSTSMQLGPFSRTRRIARIWWWPNSNCLPMLPARLLQHVGYMRYLAVWLHYLFSIYNLRCVVYSLNLNGCIRISIRISIVSHHEIIICYSIKSINLVRSWFVTHIRYLLMCVKLSLHWTMMCSQLRMCHYGIWRKSSQLWSSTSLWNNWWTCLPKCPRVP